MNRTGIEWCTHTWNPLTGCLHGCSYCYARNIARRFCTNEFGTGDGLLAPCSGDCQGCSRMDGIEFMTDSPRIACKGEVFPYGFYPTFYRHRLEEPAKSRTPKSIFVCSMADLFGAWVPIQEIRDILDAAAVAPWNRYLFLTKNPSRYNDLWRLALLPVGRFWYGTTVNNQAAADACTAKQIPNTFWSMEPLHGPVDMESVSCDLPRWVIIGAETGSRSGKVVPRREWVDDIVKSCEAHHIPVFMKDSLIPIVGADAMRREYPWEVGTS